MPAWESLGEFAASPLSLLADLVTKVVEFKHYYQKGIFARDGIER
jgi:ATP:corrinoid adenosyltransferase